MYIKTDGIVLREVAYQDSDKLLTVLTREYGMHLQFFPALLPHMFSGVL